MKIVSSAFKEGGDIPPLYTSSGQDISPPLRWENPPEETVSFVLICENPSSDKAPEIHWLVYNLSGDLRSLAPGEAIPLEQLGLNAWGHQTYSGPCAAKVKNHTPKQRYNFKLYALDTLLSFDHLGRPPHKEEVEEALQGHILATASFFGHVHHLHQGFDRPHPGKHRPGGLKS